MQIQTIMKSHFMAKNLANYDALRNLKIRIIGMDVSQEEVLN